MLIKLLNLDNLLLSLIILFISTSLTYSEEVFIEIDNPRFSEKGLSDKTYEIKAEKGLKSDNELKLFAIEGKFKTVKDGKWIYLEADKGNYSQDNNFIELQENIIELCKYDSTDILNFTLKIDLFRVTSFSNLLSKELMLSFIFLLV